MKFSDPVLQRLVEKYPAPTFRDQSDKLFENLIESIISQQLSVKAADTIFQRFKNLFTTCHLEPVSGSSFPIIASKAKHQMTTSKTKQSQTHVIPAKAGIQSFDFVYTGSAQDEKNKWIPDQSPG